MLHSGNPQVTAAGVFAVEATMCFATASSPSFARIQSRGHSIMLLSRFQLAEPPFEMRHLLENQRTTGQTLQRFGVGLQCIRKIAQNTVTISSLR